MYYCEVLVSSPRYHGNEALTYACEEAVKAGAIVQVPLGRQTVLGIVTQLVPQPSFKTKPIIKQIIDDPLPTELIGLHAWIREYYPGPIGLITQLFIPSSLATKSRLKRPVANQANSVAQPPLTTEQSMAVEAILKNPIKTALLHGETGSGKTRVYVELVTKALLTGKSSIVLTPEIGLTPQLTQTLEEAFPGKVVVVHSTQTPAERRNNWRYIHEQAEPIIVVGPRSALFSPLKNIGLIILDEAHDAAYKQDQMPYYQSSRVAAQLARLHQARLVLGTATPLVHDYFTFTGKQLPIIRMEANARGASDVAVATVDLKDRSQFSRSPWISNQLISATEDALRDGRQSLIFLNRRGTARVVLCQNCGWQAVCPRCDVPLTYHGDTHRLQCHTCGLSDRPPVSCQSCNKPEIQFKSIGTKSIVTEMQRLFPDAAIARFDSDTTKADSLEKQFDSITSGKIDILIGTQLLSKGLDLPLLQVIGIVVADTSLYFPDYTAEERTYQMLRQVIGRVGRGHGKGIVIVQTYAPQSPTITAAVKKDFAQFYESQIAERSLYKFPPFYFVLKIGVERASQSAASRSAHDLAQLILQSGRAIELSGPSPAFLEKARDKYRWQIIVRAKQRSELIHIIRMLPKTCSYDIDPSNLL